MDPSERPTVSRADDTPLYEPRSDGPARSDHPADPNPSQPAAGRSVSETTRFRVVSLHASGGMGIVFVAQDDQLHRSVALKEIQQQFADDQQIQDRFLREAEITGQLEHPGIVPVYAMGHSEDGRPYYVMRMIRGDSLKRAIAELHRLRGDEHAFRLDLRRLLNRFVTACNTIEYAHSRGVVHRDIKPDNIMLGPYGETLVVDWGLAKIVGSSAVRTDVPAGDDSVVQSAGEATTFGTVTGTPAYMSPEQALGWQDAVKPPSDVYSLGATLYSLLTGRPSVTGENLTGLLVRIQKQDFPKPRDLDPSISRPLEAICQKAMAPSVRHRYPTAAALAADLEAWLAGEPVSAWSEPFSVRAWRWIRRHRTLVTTAATSAAVLIVALLVIIGLETSANLNLTAANNRETLARKDAEAQRDKAERNFKMAQDAVDRYFTQVSEDRRLGAHGLEPLRRDLLRSAGQFYEQFVAQDPKAAVRYDSAWAQFRLAAITEEIASPAEAVAGFERAAETFRDLGKIEGGSAPHAGEGLVMCRMNLSSLYDRIGQPAKGQAALAEAFDIARALVKDYPRSVGFRHHLARCFGFKGSRALDRGDLPKAHAGYSEEIRLCEEIVRSEHKPIHEIELAGAYRNLAIVDERLERLAEARRLLGQSLVLDRKLASESPDDGFLQNTLAQSLTQLGDLAAREGKSDDAERAYREAVELRSSLVERHPDVLEYRSALAATADNLGVFCDDRGDYAAAQSYFQRAFTQAERLATDYPKSTDYQSSLATTLLDAGTLGIDQHRLLFAEQCLTRALGILEKLKNDLPNDPNGRDKLASAMLGMAIVESQTGRFQPAEEHVRSAIGALRLLSAAHPDRPFYVERLGTALKVLADVRKAAHRDNDALAAYHDAQQLQRQLIAAHPTVMKHRLDLASCCVNLGNLCGRRGELAAAAAAFDEIIQLFPPAARATLPLQARSLLESAYAGRGIAKESLGDVDGMLADCQMAFQLASAQRARRLRIQFAKVLADDKHTDRALAMAEPLVKDPNLDGPSAFEAALFFVTAAAARPPSGEPSASADEKSQAAIERRVDQALALLARADKTGYFAGAANRNRLHQPPFVPFLSKNAAFQKLLRAVEPAPPVQKPPAAN